MTKYSILPSLIIIPGAKSSISYLVGSQFGNYFDSCFCSQCSRDLPLVG